MSYCVNCGVELDPGAARCPLCGTPAWKPDPDAPSYFPTKPAEVPPASRRAAAALLTAMLASVSLCCGVLNLLLPTERPWSLYVIGAAVMLWIWFVLPMLARRIPIFFRLTADVAAVGVYVFLISIDLSGSAWFRGLALPILGWACVLVFLLSFLLRGGRRSRLSAIAMCIGTVGLMALGVEYCMDRFFRAAWQPTWSLVVVVICVGLIIPLRVVRRVPSLRVEARRRFNLLNWVGMARAMPSLFCQAASIRIFIFTRRQYNSFRFHVYDEISFSSDYWFSRHIRTYLQVWAIP